MFMRNVLRGTANIAYKMNLKTPDALHAATAVLHIQRPNSVRQMRLTATRLLLA